jgi:hypothetical protein
MKKLYVVLLFICSLNICAQEVYEPITSSIYEYIDEMANTGMIEINSCVKPYSRKLISQKLMELNSINDSLNKRQQVELRFYLKDYNKEIIKIKGNFKKRLDAFYYGDSLFQITINPIIGDRIFYNNKEFDNSNWEGPDIGHKIIGAQAFHRWAGASMFGSIGKHFAFSGSLRDNGISQNLYGETLLANHQGGVHKSFQGQNLSRTDFSEMYGSIAYSWDWGAISARKDNFTWGDSYNGSNIYSGRQPSIAHLDLKISPVKWFDFNWMHGWLVSEEIDSAATYYIDGFQRDSYYNKYMAANLFTVKPIKGTYFSIGNSVIYSDNGINPAFMIPFMFYKSVDHTYNGAGSNRVGQNSQMFMNVSTRILKYTHFYASFFLDELSIGNMFDTEQHTNLYSVKAGTRVSNLIPNTSLTFEYTRTNPWTYRHQISRTAYASNLYNMGHYLGENAEQIYGAIQFKPISTLHVTISYSNSIKGPETEYKIIHGVANVKGLVFMENVVWSNQKVTIKTSYEVVNDLLISLQFLYQNTSGSSEQFTPELYYGKTNTVILGLNYGF